MAYRLRTTQSAEKEIARLDPKIRRQVVEKLLTLEDNPRPQELEPLVGEEEAYWIDSGGCRILLKFNDKSKEVTICRVKLLREAWRDL